MLDERTVDSLSEWMSSYLAQPHPELKRSGAVCPFVRPGMDAGGIRIKVISALTPRPDLYVLDSVRRALDEFPPPELAVRRTSARALVLAFPDLVGRGEIIDHVHAETKDEAVRAGLMIGQLHPRCTEPSARNAAFAVNLAPIPLLAIRHMAVHDILFLNDRDSWFHEYDERFGHHYRNKRQIDPLLRQHYERAAARFGHTRAELAHAGSGSAK